MSRKKPNIIFLVNDHQAFYGHGEMAGGPKIQRPNYERLAKGGAEFLRTYTSCPLCCPSRRSMLTGLFPHNHGEIKNLTYHPFDKITYLEILSKNGYKNYFYGKWHAGPGTAYDHKCEGFNYRGYGNPYTKPEYKKYLKKYNLPPFQVHIERIFYKPNGFIARLYGIKVNKPFRPKRRWNNEHAMGIMKTPKETHESFFLAKIACEKLRELVNSGNQKPFHLRVDFWGPHQPYYITPEFLDMYEASKIPEYPSFNENLRHKPKIYKTEFNYPLNKKHELIYPNPLPWSEWQKILVFNYAHQTMIDQAGGLILDALDELDLTDNTLVMWTADHGDAIASHGGHFDKHSYMPEEVIRIPLAIRYPVEIPPGQKIENLVSNIDFAPTILDVAETSFEKKIDGQSLIPLCSGNEIDWRDDLMIETHGHHFRLHIGRSIVTKRYKYIWNDRDMDELYDLDEDPYELNNLIYKSEYSEILGNMKMRLADWRRKVGDSVKRDMIKKKMLGITHRLRAKNIPK